VGCASALGTAQVGIILFGLIGGQAAYVPPSAMPHTQLFVVNGDSAAGSLRHGLGLGPESILVQHDVLSCGPLPPFESLAQWRKVRDEFWRGIGDGPDSSDSPYNVLHNDEELRQADRVLLWVGSGLSDQLLLPSTVRLFELIGADPAKLLTVQVSRVPGKHVEIVGLGELSPGELKTIAASEPISAVGVAELSRVWTALTAPDPRGLVALLREESRSFALLYRALKTMILRYPDVQTGLNYIDWELLKHSKAFGPKAVHVIAHTIMSNAEHLDPVGDVYLLARIRRLADPHLPHPALELAGDPRSIRGCEVKVTSTGEEMLAGRRNFIELNGIDDWVGGVHLDSRAEMVWFRRGGELILRQ